MGKAFLHIRRSYQIEEDKRWSYWSAVLKSEDGEAIIASTRPRKIPPPTYPRKLSLVREEREMPVARFEYDERLEADGKALVAQLQGDGWEPAERDVHGRVVRMRRDS